MRKLAIVGAGKVGTVLGRIFVDNGGQVVSVVSRTQKSAGIAGRFLHCRNVSDSLASIPPSTELIYITTPHAAVEGVALGLSRLDHLAFRKLSVCHASGMLTAKALAPLSKRGATVFSFHPLQTFPRDFKARDIVPTARGLYYAVDGSARGLRVARQFARRLDGRIIQIKPAMRVFYHAACVVASNHLTAMLSVLDTMYRRFDKNEKDFFRVFKPIITATLYNIERTSPAEALSGPVARGGVETVAGHLSAIKQFAPDLLPYFGTLTLETVRLAERKGSITDDRALALRKLVRSFVPDSQTKERH